jgi:hypothetical protein
MKGGGKASISAPSMDGWTVAIRVESIDDEKRISCETMTHSYTQQWRCSDV